MKSNFYWKGNSYGKYNFYKKFNFSMRWNLTSILRVTSIGKEVLLRNLFESVLNWKSDIFPVQKG